MGPHTCIPWERFLGDFVEDQAHGVGAKADFVQSDPDAFNLPAVLSYSIKSPTCRQTAYAVNDTVSLALMFFALTRQTLLLTGRLIVTIKSPSSSVLEYPPPTTSSFARHVTLAVISR